MIYSFRAALALSAFLALTACQTAQEKAEGFYQSGLALLAAGDADRALVEFRNVFEYDGFHKAARQTYADTQLDRGLIDEAYAQYLRLVEQYPDEVEARLTLARIAVTRGDWAEVRRHGEMAATLAPDDPRSRAMTAAIAYRAAVTDLDPVGARAAVDQAHAVLAIDPENITAIRIVIDAFGKSDTPADALPYLDAALQIEPLGLEFHIIKLRIVSATNADAGIAQLKTMFTLFPDNPEVRASLVSWYLSQKDFDAAEDLLRQLAGDVTGPTAGHVTVVQFLQQARGTQAAMAELAALIAANADTANADLYRAMQASLVFEGGTRDAGVMALRDIIANTGDDQSAQTQQIRIMLATMLQTMGEKDAARTEVDAILAIDSAHVPALKMQAAWLIADDDPDAAITTLRTALNQSPRDPEIMIAMAAAHIRAGSPELAGERLALAVDVSGNAPDVSLQYVQFLLQNGRTPAAETVLLDARRAYPANLEIVSRLADLWLGQQNWLGARSLLDDLRQLDGPQAAGIATALEAEILMGQNQTDESLALLQEQLAGLDNDVRATVTITLAQIRSGKTDEARSFLDAALTTRPDNVPLRLLSGSLAMMTGDAALAQSTFEAVLDTDPASEPATRQLYTLLSLQGNDAGAMAVIDAGIAADPQAATLHWIKAGALEQQGDIDAAIVIYEDLYAIDSGNVIVANNLASLIATHRDDAASLTRAFTIARRLRGMDVPAFQDTYGWIVARRGDYADALTYLRPAAAGLPDDPLVQFHLGMTYAGLDQKPQARAALVRALALAGNSALPQFDVARETLEELGGAG